MKRCRLIDWIKEKISTFFERWTYSKCYGEQEYLGHTIFGMCGGLVGGDRNTNYLSYDCIDYPYFAKTFDLKDQSGKIKEGFRDVD